MTPARQVAETDGVKTCKDPSDCDLNKLYMIAYMIVHVIGISTKFTFAFTRQLSYLHWHTCFWAYTCALKGFAGYTFKHI